MTDPPLTPTATTLRVAAMGFWLPCNQSFFFAHYDDIRTLTNITAAQGAGGPASRGQPSPAHRLPTDAPNLLQASVFSRLMAVLASKGYSGVYPLPDTSHEQVTSKRDPEMLVFTAVPSATLMIPRASTAATGPGNPGEAGATATETTADAVRATIHWPEPTCPLRALALCVDARGFYVWVAVYESSFADEHKKDEVKAEAELVRKCLQEHILEAVGGDYYSHYSGLPDDREKATDEDERQHNLEEYRDKRRGILTFFQINTILEGLFNATLDPRVFFAGEGSAQVESVSAVKQMYSLGKFINLIAEPLRPNEILMAASKSTGKGKASSSAANAVDGQLADDAAEGEPESPDLRKQETDKARKQITDEAKLVTCLLALTDQISLAEAGMNVGSYEEAASLLAHAVLSSRADAHILWRFLRATADRPLQDLKRRIERCRRALLSEMVEITHRQEPLLQVEPPDDIEDRIEGVNEDQLRGYVMVLAAKLPLISNIEFYLDVLAKDEKLWDHRPQGRSAYHAWTMLLKSITNNVVRLEAAVNQASEDRQLSEQEQIRAEQETLNELERLRSRTEATLSPSDTLTINFISNFLALSAVVLTLFSVIKSTPNLNFPGDLFQQSFLIVLRNILVGALVLTVGYILLQNGIAWIFRKLNLFARRQHREEERYYYEFDIRLQAAMTETRAQDLFEARFDIASPAGAPGPTASAPTPAKRIRWRRIRRAWRKWRARRAWREQRARQRDLADASYTLPERNSYRVQRAGKDSALHKVYVETDIDLDPRRWFQFWRRRLHLILVYEVAFHRPAQKPSYIFQDLRVVMNHPRLLDAEEIDHLKHAVVTFFVNRWLDYAPSRLEPPDALFTMYVGTAPRTRSAQPSAGQPEQSVAPPAGPAATDAAERVPVSVAAGGGGGLPPDAIAGRA